MVRINRVYTKTGDQGKTALVGGLRVDKDDLRIEAYGTVDELNAHIGMVRVALDGFPDDGQLSGILKRVQNELFNLGSELATPSAQRRKRQPAVTTKHVEALEREMDEMNDHLPELRSFVLPGGGEVSARLHVARTVCRRAERLTVALARTGAASSPGGDSTATGDGGPRGVEAAVEETALVYLNRLSDALFVFGRHAVRLAGEEEPLWEPEKT